MSPIWLPGDVTASFESLPTLTPFSIESIGMVLLARTQAFALQAGTAVYPVASLAMYFPFRLAMPTSFDSMFTSNGTVAGNSIDVGVYTEDGARLASKGLTAQAGTNVVQAFAFSAPLVLAPGKYYMAISMNGTTGTLSRVTGGTLSMVRLAGASQEDLSGAGTPGTLPATATFAAMAQSYVPLFGLSRTGYTL